MQGSYRVVAPRKLSTVSVESGHLDVHMLISDREKSQDADGDDNRCKKDRIIMLYRLQPTFSSIEPIWLSQVID